jgi:hypothetical protein
MESNTLTDSKSEPTLESLTELANKYASDKGTAGPSRNWNANNYTDVYEGYFHRLRFKEINLLEIGLGVIGEHWDAKIVHGRNTGGASLRMWYEYFPNANIWGIDINPASHLENDRIRTFQLNQGSPDDLSSFVSSCKSVEFDIVIDDGSHLADHQQLSFGYLFQKVKSRGYYVIEDLMDNGISDDCRSSISSRTSKSTREVLKYFRKNQEFAEPHSIPFSDQLCPTIDNIAFHCPKMAIGLKFKLNLLRPLWKHISYFPNSESVCIISKK